MARKYIRTKPIKPYDKHTDYTGSKFHKLLVVSCIEPNRGGKNKGGRWKVRCDCGKEREITGYNLSIVKSCGCLTEKHLKNLARNHRTYQTATWNVQYSQHKSGATLRGFSPLAREDWFKIVNKPCFYCGMIDVRNRATSEAYRKKAGATLIEGDIEKYSILCNGVDRVDSKYGYQLDNVVPCCGMCNNMKNNYSTEEFIDKIKLIVSRL
jgi:hypothetical protein